MSTHNMFSQKNKKNTCINTFWLKNLTWSYDDDDLVFNLCLAV